jgi:multidrug efflux pump subunit AcrA (membrane-fusion protein)
MSNKKGTVTIVLIFLIALFVALSGWTLFKGRAAPGPGSQPQTGPAPSGAQGRPGGGPPGGGEGTRPQQGQRPTGGGTAQRAAVTVRAAEVVRGTIKNSVSVYGDVVAARQVSIYPQTGGRITELRYRIGDSVKRGDTVARIDPSRPGEVYAASPVLSPISGTILEIFYSTGDTVGTSSAIYTVGDLSSIVVETAIPERFSPAIRQGLRAEAYFEALPDETFPMAVIEISPVLDTASRTLRIRLQFQGAIDSRIRAGMYATVNLVTASRVNVPVIPRACLINTYGDWVVFTVDQNNTAHRRVIKIGLENEDSVEIADGLEPGEIVVSVGQNFLSDGEQVRVVE